MENFILAICEQKNYNLSSYNASIKLYKSGFTIFPYIKFPFKVIDRKRKFRNSH